MIKYLQKDEACPLVEASTTLRLNHYCSYPGRGGAGLAADRLVRGLRQKGCEAKLYGLEIDEDRAHHARLPEVDSAMDRLRKHWRARQLRQIPAGYRGLSSAGTCFFSDRSCHGLALPKTYSGVHAIHFHWMCDLMDYQDTLARIPIGVPLIWTLHDMSPFTGGCSYSLDCDGYQNGCSICPHVSSPLAQRETARSHARKRHHIGRLRNSVICVSPSEWLTRLARRSSILGEVPCVTIPNGLDLKIFNPRLRAGARRSLDLEGSRPVILFASAQIQNPLKSIRLVEKVITAAGLTCANCRVVYVGELLGGDLPDWWRWLGNLSTESAMARCFAAADLTIVPSVVDNYPNVVAESLACGTPVLGSRVGGIPELVDHEYNGFLFKAGDVGEASELMRLWANSKPSALNGMRVRARESAEAAVDVHDTSRQYMDLYQAMLESTQRASCQG